MRGGSAIYTGLVGAVERAREIIVLHSTGLLASCEVTARCGGERKIHGIVVSDRSFGCVIQNQRAIITVRGISVSATPGRTAANVKRAAVAITIQSNGVVRPNEWPACADDMQ